MYSCQVFLTLTEISLTHYEVAERGQSSCIVLMRRIDNLNWIFMDIIKLLIRSNRLGGQEDTLSVWSKFRSDSGYGCCCWHLFLSSTHHNNIRKSPPVWPVQCVGTAHYTVTNQHKPQGQDRCQFQVLDHSHHQTSSRRGSIVMKIVCNTRLDNV